MVVSRVSIAALALVGLLLAAGSSSAQGRAVAMLADLDGTALVKRGAKADTLEAYVGLELFAGDRLRSERGCRVSLFYEQAGLARIQVPAGADGLEIGKVPPPVEKPGFWSGLEKSLSGLLGDRNAVDRAEIGAVQSGFILIRPQVGQVSGDRQKSDTAGGGPPPAEGKHAADALSEETEKLQGAPGSGAAPGSKARESNLDVGALRSPPQATSVADPGADRETGRAAHAEERAAPRAPSGQDEGVTRLVRCRVIKTIGTPPALLAVSGIEAAPRRDLFGRDGERALGPLSSSDRLADGLPVLLRISPATPDQPSWSLVLEVAPQQEWAVVRGVVERLKQSGPEGLLLAGRVMERQRYLFAALVYYSRYLDQMRAQGRSDRALAMLCQKVGELALAAGSWPSARDASASLARLTGSRPAR